MSIAMLHLHLPPYSFVIRTLAVYFGMLFGFRIFGKRELGQMTVFDLAMVLLIANAVQNSMVGPDTSLLGGLIVMVTLLAVNLLIARLGVHDRFFRRLLEGGPSVLISRGEWNDTVLRREGMSRDEVRMAMREQGVLDADEVRLAVLEANGNISIVPKDSPTIDAQRSKKRNLGRRQGRDRH